MSIYKIKGVVIELLAAFVLAILMFAGLYAVMWQIGEGRVSAATAADIVR